MKRYRLLLLAACYLLPVFFFSCSPNNVKTDNSLGDHFKNAAVEGSFALLNNANGEFTMYNLPRYRDSAYLPAATFDVVNALVGLQTGKIVNDSMVIKWDGANRLGTACNADLSMYSAFRLSCPAWFGELARRIGKDTMQHWLDSLSYGNKKISRIDTFWLDNSLKVRPDEELGLMKKLYFNQLPFFKLNQEIVKNAMLMEDTPNYKLSYKTGLGHNERGKNIVWIVGWIEENRHPFFFALNFETGHDEADLQALSMNLLKSMLKQLGFMEGKM